MSKELPKPIDMGLTPIQRMTIRRLITIVQEKYHICLDDVFMADEPLYTLYLPYIFYQLAEIPFFSPWPAEWTNVNYRTTPYTYENIHTAQVTLNVYRESMDEPAFHVIGDGSGVISFLRGFL